jgi:hypothetical protein
MYYPRICIDKLTNATKTFTQDSQCLGRHSNRAPLEYGSEAFQLEIFLSVFCISSMQPIYPQSISIGDYIRYLLSQVVCVIINQNFHDFFFPLCVLCLLPHLSRHLFDKTMLVELLIQLFLLACAVYPVIRNISLFFHSEITYKVS